MEEGASNDDDGEASERKNLDVKREWSGASGAVAEIWSGLLRSVPCSVPARLLASQLMRHDAGA